jgi:hypothetical protein
MLDVLEASRLHPALQLRAWSRLAPGLGAGFVHELGQRGERVALGKGLVVRMRVDIPVLELGPAARRSISMFGKKLKKKNWKRTKRLARGMMTR